MRHDGSSRDVIRRAFKRLLNPACRKNERSSGHVTIYVVVPRNRLGPRRLPEEIQVVMSRWIAWFDDLIRQDKAKLGQPLKDEARIVSGREGQSLVDGPFTESKEVS
jgi:hypothetical protein